MKRRIASIVVFNILCLPLLFGNTAQELALFAKKATMFAYNFAQEKVYLHFDNTGYFLGENILFKAYVVNAMDNTPSDMSKTLYVELLTQEGDIMQSQKKLLNNGVCSGSFSLQDSLPGGFYEVRAYTRAMLNFGEQTLFSRVFPVYSKPSNEGVFNQRIMNERSFNVPSIRAKQEEKEKEEQRSSTIAIQFYPEGGTLVQGITSYVAFKVTDKTGKALNVNGIILDNQGKQIQTFATLHEGMGRFSITPDSTSCSAVVQYNGKKVQFTLPSAEPSGYTVTLNRDTMGNASPTLSIHRSPNLQQDSLALVIQCRGKLLDFRIFDVPEEGKLLKFPDTHFAEGVNQFTLYDSKGMVMADRLYFVQPQASEKEEDDTKGENKSNKKKYSIATLDYSTNKKYYSPFEKITLELQAHDTLATNTGTSISLAVRDAQNSNFAGPDNTDIATMLLLASDIKGYIANPRWYFQRNDETHAMALDLLLCTQGWRRYKWERMEGVEEFKPQHPIEEGILIDGYIKTVVRKKTVPDVALILWITQGDAVLRSNTSTDSTGKFAFIMPPFFGEWKLNIHTRVEDKTKDFRILINRQFAPKPKVLTGHDTEVWVEQAVKEAPTPRAEANELLGRWGNTVETPLQNTKDLKTYQLKDVVISAKKPTSLRETVMRDASISFDVSKDLDKIRDIGNTENESIMDFLKKKLIYFNYGEVSLLPPPHSEPPVYLFMKINYKSRPVRFKVFFNDGSTSNALSDIYTIEYEYSVSNAPLPSLTMNDIERIAVVEKHDEIYDVEPTLLNASHYDYKNEYVGIRSKELSESYPVYIFLFLKKDFAQDPLGTRSTAYQGYTISKEFYSPVYPEGQPVIDPDYRRTLYWNPDIILDKTGKATVEFFNNSSCKQMNVSAEGITSNGVLLKNK